MSQAAEEFVRHEFARAVQARPSLRAWVANDPIAKLSLDVMQRTLRHTYDVLEELGGHELAEETAFYVIERIASQAAP